MILVGMHRPMVVGVLVSTALLVVVLVLYLHKVIGTATTRERFGRYEFRVFRNGNYVDEGTSFRKEDPEELDWVARQVLEEWFDGPKGERELAYSGYREAYKCVVILPGYGVGEAYGR